MIGYHTKFSGKDPYKSISDAYKKTNCKAFQIYLKNPRSWSLANINEENAIKCHEFIKSNNIFLVAHQVYPVSTATLNDKGINSAVDDMIWIKKLGGIGVVFHIEKAKIGGDLDQLRKFINICLSRTTDTLFILETMAGQSDELLVDLQEFGNFYKSLNSDRVKVCVDTCHVFSAGYDIRLNKFYDNFNKWIGWKNVVVCHLNDSKTKFNSKRDRHENLGEGSIGINGIKLFINKNKDIPMILETPNCKLGNMSKDIKKISL